MSLKLQVLDLQRKYEQKIDYYKHTIEYQKKLLDQYKMVTENVPDVIWLMDLTTLKITYINSGIYFLTGYTPDEMLKKNISEILVPDSVHKILEILANRYDKYESCNREISGEIFEWKQYCKNGAVKSIETTTNFVYNEQDARIYLLGIARDASEHQTKLNNMIQKTDKLKQDILDRDNLFSVVEHDLKDPLADLLDATSLLNEKHNLLSEKEKISFYERNFLNAKQLYNFVRDLFKWSNLQRNLITCSPFLFDISFMIKRMTARLEKEMLKKKIVITTSLHEQYVFADIFMIENVLTTILNRISELSPNGGTIAIETGKADKEDDSKFAIRIIDRVNKGQAGITNEMFKTVNRTDDSYKEPSQILNFKLALAGCYLQKNSGSISAECGEKKIITITLPKYSPEKMK